MTTTPKGGPRKPGKRTKRRTGPRGLYGPERHAVIVEEFRRGTPTPFVAAAAGISLSCLSQWLRKGEEEGSEYASLLEDVRAAEAEWVRESLDEIQRYKGAGSWKARAWLLEKRHPEVFGPRLVVTGEDGGAVNVRHEVDGLSAALARLAERGGK